MRRPTGANWVLTGVSQRSFLFITMAFLAATASLEAGTGSFEASRAFADWAASHRGRAVPDEVDSARGLELARLRGLEMKQLMEQDPEAFVRQSMPDQERNQLPP